MKKNNKPFFGLYERIGFRLGDILGLPFLKDAKFYFALFNTVVIFSQRLDVQFTTEEIASVNLLIAVIFGVSPPTLRYMAQVRENNIAAALALKRQKENE